MRTTGNEVYIAITGAERYPEHIVGVATTHEGARAEIRGHRLWADFGHRYHSTTHADAYRRKAFVRDIQFEGRTGTEPSSQIVEWLFDEVTGEYYRIERHAVRAVDPVEPVVVIIQDCAAAITGDDDDCTPARRCNYCVSQGVTA